MAGRGWVKKEGSGAEREGMRRSQRELEWISHMRT